MEAVATNNGLRLIDRRQPAEIRDLGPNQLAWCEARWPWFSDQRRMQRDQETYRRAYGLQP